MPDPFIRSLGPAQIDFDVTSVGEMTGGTWTYSQEQAPVKTAQYGTSPKDEITTGNTCTIEVRLTESTFAQLAAVLPNADVSGLQLMVRSNVGASARANAAKLTIKPIENGTVVLETTGKWITFFVAAAVAQFAVPFDAETQREYGVLFKAYPALSVPSGETYAVGDIYAIGYKQTA